MFMIINTTSLIYKVPLRLAYIYWNISALTNIDVAELLQILTRTECEWTILSSETNSVIWWRHSSYDFREDLKPELFQFQSLWRANVTKVSVSCPALHHTHTMLSPQDEQNAFWTTVAGKCFVFGGGHLMHLWNIALRIMFMSPRVIYFRQVAHMLWHVHCFAQVKTGCFS